MYFEKNSFADSKTRKVIQRKYKSNMVRIKKIRKYSACVNLGECIMFFCIILKLRSLWLILNVFIVFLSRVY